MPKRVTATALNATSAVIANTIRQNSSADYQRMVPEIRQARDFPAVGEVLYGYPALANEFCSQLINRIALVVTNSAAFNNPYAVLKKGMLNFGETIEEVFTQIAKGQKFDQNAAKEREFKRTPPDVRTAFHPINFKNQYPVTISQEQLRAAFMNAEGVTDLINTIMDSVLTAHNYDEFLLFKYVLIKEFNRGTIHHVTCQVDGDGQPNTAAGAVQTFKAISNQMTFMRKDYNEAGVLTTTPKSNQIIVIPAQLDAEIDVNVLAAAFNMDKAEFIGRKFLIDNFTEFDNDRFADFIADETMEPVTSAELTAMKDVQAIIADDRWFQFYDNLMQYSDQKVASTLSWNYWYNTWKTVSHSPFHNIVGVMKKGEAFSFMEYVSFIVSSKSVGMDAYDAIDDDSHAIAPVSIVLSPNDRDSSSSMNFFEKAPYRFMCVNEGTTDPGKVRRIGVRPEGIFLFPRRQNTSGGDKDTDIVVGDIISVEFRGPDGATKTYTHTVTSNSVLSFSRDVEVGDVIDFTSV